MSDDQEFLSEDEKRDLNKLAGTKDLDKARKEERREAQKELGLIQEEKKEDPEYNPSPGAVEDEKYVEEEGPEEPPMDDMDMDEPEDDEMGDMPDDELGASEADVEGLVQAIADAIEEKTGVPIDVEGEEGMGDMEDDVPEPELEDPVDMDDGPEGEPAPEPEGEEEVIDEDEEIDLSEEVEEDE